MLADARREFVGGTTVLAVAGSILNGSRSVCTNCGSIFDADVNAAKNILKLGISPTGGVPGMASPGALMWTITNKSYWPNEARQSAQSRTVGGQRDLNSALADDWHRQARSRWRIQIAVDPLGVIMAARNPADVRVTQWRTQCQ